MIGAPPGWRSTTLGTICAEGGGELQTGPFGSQLHAHDYVEDGVPLVMPRDLVAGRIDTSKVARVGEADAERLSQHRLRTGDVIFSRRGDVGRFAIVRAEEAGWLCGTGCLRARLGVASVEPRYLHWCLLRPSTVAWFQDNAQGATMPNLNTSILSRTPLDLPPLPVQRRIAVILDEADGLRRKRREGLGLLDDLLRATFLDMFGDPVSNPRGWEAMLLDDLADVQGGLQVTAQRTEPLEVPYLRVANVYRDRLDLREIKTIRVTPAERERVRLQSGDVLVVEGHGNPDEVGRAAVWDRAEEMLHQNHLIRVRANGARLDSVYLSAFLNSPGGRRQMVRAGKTTSGLNTISTSNVKATTVLLPPLRLQRQWSDFVRACSAERRRAEGHVAHVDALFSALLLRAFAGELWSHDAT